MQQSKQMSESIRLGVIMAMAGGFMDAYSYICREKVFANAQTGNMLLLGINIAEGNGRMAVRYLCPVVAFTIGIVLAEMIRLKTKDENHFHWRQISVLFEMLILAAVAFIPQRYNLAANSLTSLVCGIQVESFRKIHGNGIATTMCIGNLRSATQNICEYWNTGNKEAAGRGALYYGIIFTFVLGAVFGNFFIKILGEKAILVCAGLLLPAFVMMFIEKETGAE